MLDRRGLLIGAAALAAAPPALAAESASRRFRILRNGSDIGRHALDARLTEDGFSIGIDIDIRVRVLGITAYRYTLTNREVWKDGRLVSLESRTDDDGTRERATVTREGDRLAIDGTGYSGTAPLEAVTTSYYTTRFHDRRPWISTQSGKPLSVSIAARSDERFKVTGDLTTLLIYDDRGEWVGCEFDAGGEPARYELADGTGAIAALWAQA